MAQAYTQREGGEWVKFPWQFGRIYVRCFLDHIEVGEGSDLGLFHYAGSPLIFHSVRFADPFMGTGYEGLVRKGAPDDRNIFDVEIWKLTGFTTGWRDELADWRKAGVPSGGTGRSETA